MRHAATRAVLTRRDCIVVASVSCIYGIGSPDAYMSLRVSLETGMPGLGKDFSKREFDRDELLAALRKPSSTRLYSVRHALLAGVAAAAALSSAGAATAQEEEFTLGELVVTAQKRTERLQDVPVSVNVVSAQALADNLLGLELARPAICLDQAQGQLGRCGLGSR